MPRFIVSGKCIDLPGMTVDPKAATRDRNAWLAGQYLTIRLLAPLYGFRVHTDGRAFAGRPASSAAGAWVALGDVIQTSHELRDARSLPGAFTHVGEAAMPRQCVLNVGVCSPLFGAVGGGFQAEYVSGPLIQFKQLHGKHWHGRAATA